MKYLECALKAKLTVKENRVIRMECERLRVVGDRYPEAMMTDLFADTSPLKQEGNVEREKYQS